MKKKYLLQDWEQEQRGYYSNISKSEVSDIYEEWFSQNVMHGHSKRDLVEMLIDDELIYRSDDSIEDLIETIEELKTNKL
jgi:predicted transcriptional regulator